MRTTRCRAAGIALGVAATMLALDAYAAGLEAPGGPVVLTVEGAPATNGEGAARFDMAMLDALPQRSIVTTTPWYKGPTRFEGPALADVLAKVGASGRAVSAHALNDYVVRIPGEDASKGAILATRRDGAVMPPDDKGPIFVMYPFDAEPSLKVQAYFSRCIWQLDSIVVE